MLEIIKATLESGDDVQVSGFGKFCLKEKVECKGRNPSSGEEAILPARRVGPSNTLGKYGKGEREMNNPADRRRYPRYNAVFSIKYRVKEGAFRDIIGNIGVGGVFVGTKREISLSQPINIQIPLFAFEKRLSIFGTVVRCESDGFAVMFNEALEVKIFNDGQFPGNAN